MISLTQTRISVQLIYIFHIFFMTENQKQNPSVLPPGKAAQTAGEFIWDLVKIFVIAGLIIWPFRAFVAEPFVVSGSSMLPNFSNHDYLIIDRFSYRTGQPYRGDVVVFRFPKDTSQYFIKRIIGLPGETIACQKGKVEVLTGSGENLELQEAYLPNSAATLNCKARQVLGSDEYFVLGDNRSASSDSRFWGVLPKDDIVGKVWARVYPFSKSQFVHTPNYQ